MQQLYLLHSLLNYDINEFNKNYLNKGWIIKDVIIKHKESDKILFLLEKTGRKEKLENLNNLK